MQTFDLKRFRKDKNLTQVEVAELFSCKQNFISNIEAGLKAIPQDKIELLQSKYGDISDYMTRKGDIDFKIKNATPYDVVAMGGEVYANLLNKLIREKQLAPFALLEQKDQEIKELNREIGRLEERLENSKKMDAQEDGNVGCVAAK